MRWNRLHAQKGEGVRQGLQPCTCFKPKPKPKQDQRRLWLAVSWAGRCGLAGHAVNPPPGSGPAAGGCAFGRLRSGASQAKRPHPWGLVGAIHGACGPASPHRPAPDRFTRLLVGADRWSARPSDIQMNLGSEAVPTNGRHPPVQEAVPPDRGELSKAGWVRLRGCERHGCRDQAPMDGFTASPSTGPTPPTHGKPAFDVDLALAGAGLQALPREPPSLLRRRMHGWALPALLQSI